MQIIQIREPKLHTSQGDAEPAGLVAPVPGLSYALTVGLENGGNMVALSTRTFSVGSILLPGVDGRLSVADALEAGAQLHNAQDRGTAARIYRYVLDIFPDHGQAQHLLGLALYQDGELRQALPLLYRAVQSNESEENFHNSLGICLKSLGRADEAIKHYRRALELNPMQVQASVNLGDAMQSKGKWEEALKEYSKVAKAPMSLLDSQLEPGKSEHVAKDATGRMCELIRVTDGWYHADRCLNKALERWPDEPVFHNDRGNLLANAGQFETALDEYQRSSDFGLLVGTLNLADTLEALGETQKSIDLYDQVLGNEVFDRFHPQLVGGSHYRNASGKRLQRGAWAREMEARHNRIRSSHKHCFLLLVHICKRWARTAQSNICV
ncbi:protein N-acetylglucosaminyltransferase [Phytophthora pseudosyringae]|uniref:Protein N-acetylglucosaminyltransferase n=1 Tax=Phytophthora pseudosyringae TaxID=221518 RepID=A0A8T1VNJ4_9STRA|nr:protein N-acetylglucosaminyltransferase [Phytophthora pseudosyringae]